MFALDSIPAVFAVTTDPFIVFSSNLFAILGLRSLYFLLAGLLDRLVYLKAGLAVLLVFAGAKILVGAVYEIPVAVSLAVVVAILGTAVAASLVATNPHRAALLPPALRIATGVVLGFVGVGFVALAVAIRDGAAWLAPLAGVALDVGVLGSAAAVVVLVSTALRHAHARSAIVRGWAGAGVALLLVLALFIAMD